MSRISKKGRENLKAYIAHLEQEKNKERKDLEQAASYHDLSENSTFHLIKERLNLLDRQIQELQAKIAESVVVIPPKNPEYVSFGTSVLLEDEQGKKYKYKIVSDYESEEEEDSESISENSIIAQAIMTKKVGEVAKFNTRRGIQKLYTILKISGQSDEELV